jgi:hypothetical protein
MPGTLASKDLNFMSPGPNEYMRGTQTDKELKKLNKRMKPCLYLIKSLHEVI